MDLTHFDENGNARMVDISEKDLLIDLLLLVEKYLLMKKLFIE